MSGNIADLYEYVCDPKVETKFDDKFFILNISVTFCTLSGAIFLFFPSRHVGCIYFCDRTQLVLTKSSSTSIDAIKFFLVRSAETLRNAGRRQST